MKRLDLIILAIVFFGAAVAFFVSRFGMTGEPGAPVRAEIYFKNELIRTVSLSETHDFVVEDAGDFNHIVVANGHIRVAAASCDNQSCVHMGEKSLPGELIACLPNRVSIRLIGMEEGVDAIAGHS